MNNNTIIYTQVNKRTERTAVVIMPNSAPAHLPFKTLYYSGDSLEHECRFSRAGLAEAAADNWCNNP